MSCPILYTWYQMNHSVIQGLLVHTDWRIADWNDSVISKLRKVMRFYLRTTHKNQKLPESGTWIILQWKVLECSGGPTQTILMTFPVRDAEFRRWENEVIAKICGQLTRGASQQARLGEGKYLWGFLTPPVAGADLRAALVASCFLGALPPVDLRAVCFVRAILLPLLKLCVLLSFGLLWNLCGIQSSSAEPNLGAFELIILADAGRRSLADDGRLEVSGPFNLTPSPKITNLQLSNSLYTQHSLHTLLRTSSHKQQHVWTRQGRQGAWWAWFHFSCYLLSPSLPSELLWYRSMVWTVHDTTVVEISMIYLMAYKFCSQSANSEDLSTTLANRLVSCCSYTSFSMPRDVCTGHEQATLGLMPAIDCEADCSMIACHVCHIMHLTNCQSAIVSQVWLFNAFCLCHPSPIVNENQDKQDIQDVLFSQVKCLVQEREEPRDTGRCSGTTSKESPSQQSGG